MGAIYRILNVVNDNFYIGSARNPKKRRWEHWNDLKKHAHHCIALQAAWDEFGPDAFEFIVLEEVENEADLARIEDMYLAQSAGQPDCYNTARSSLQPPSIQPETIDKIRTTTLNNWANDPLSHPRRGRTHTPETKARISASRKGKMAGADHYRYGKKLSYEVRKKISDAQRGVKKAPRNYTPEGLAKMRETMRRVVTEHPQQYKPFSEVFAKFPAEVRKRYDFTNAVYTGALARITGVNCPEHGLFSQYAAQFRKGRGCPRCGAAVRGAKKKLEMKAKWASQAYRETIINSQNKGRAAARNRD